MPLTRSDIEQEDMAMWKFAMEDHPGHGRQAQWELFRERNTSKRTAQGLYIRFIQALLPYLAQTKFHVETKLRMCQKYDVKVEDEFLKELQEDADVELDEHGYVFSYQLKPNCRQNMDMEMNDEEFREITTRSFPCFKHWTHDEEEGLWNYLLENSELYARGKQQFWKDLIAKLNWNRTPNALKKIFHRRLARNLHKTDFSIEQKLKLYKNCQIPVDEEYLKTLKEYAYVEIDRCGCIAYYMLKDDRSGKRKASGETDGCAKKAKSDPGTSSEVQEEHDLILENVFSGGWPNLDMIIQRPPKIKIDDDKDATMEELVIPKEEVFDGLFSENLQLNHFDEGADYPVNFDDSQLNENWEGPIVEERSEDQSDSIVKMLEIMQKMEQKIENQEAKLIEMSELVQTMAGALASLQSEMQTVRNKIVGIPDDASIRKQYFLNFKKFVSLLESPELEPVEQNLPENENPIEAHHSEILDEELSLIGF